MQIQYISFDIYDTLIGRLYPTEILYGMMGERIQSDGVLRVNKFSAKRIEAEQILITQGKRYYTLRDIYGIGEFAGLDRQQQNYLIRLEEEFEMQNAYPLVEGKSLFEQYKRDRKKIICISDMYLRSGVLNMILSKNGYDVEKIYVSCECGASKRDGTLFKYVLSDMDVPAREILHIGDAVRSDILNAGLKGMKSHRVSRNRAISYNEYYELGFQRLGRILFEFIKWIHKQSEGRKLIFLTREGAFFQQCFHMLYDDDSHLMAVSRKSVIKGALPILLKQNRFSEIVSDWSLQLTDTVADLFKRVGLSVENYENELQNVGIVENESINRATLNQLDILFEIYKQKIIFELKDDQVLFDSYLKQFVDKNDSVALVDIGWKGSMQNVLQAYWRLNDGPQDVLGLYFGTVRKGRKKGFLFEAGDKHEQNTLCFVGLLEILTTPYMGSVIGYRSDGKLIVPVYAKPEFSETSAEHINAVQNGILEYIRRAVYFKEYIDEGLEKAKDKLVRWGCAPRREDIDLLGSLDIYDNGTSMQLIEPITIKDLVHPKEIKRKILQSKWKSGALKRLLFINFPYNRLINYLRKKKTNIR